ESDTPRPSDRHPRLEPHSRGQASAPRVLATRNRVGGVDGRASARRPDEHLLLRAVSHGRSVGCGGTVATGDRVDVETGRPDARELAPRALRELANLR